VIQEKKPDAWNVEQYEKFKKERSQPFYDLLGMIEPITGGKIVDLGCGAGELTKVLHEKLEAADTLGIDSSENMLEKAKTFAGNGLHFNREDIERFSEPNGYDLMFSNASLQWCGNHFALFHSIRECLKKDGQIAIQMPMNQDYISHTMAAEVANRPKYKKYISKNEAQFKQQSILKPDDYASLLFDLGFKRQKVYVNVYGHLLENREMVIEWVKGTMLTYYQKILPEAVYKDFFKEYREGLFAVLPEREPFFYPFKRILMWASLRA
jgi:trans-aconitate 2-methyltransferase